MSCKHAWGISQHIEAICGQYDTSDMIRQWEIIYATGVSKWFSYVYMMRLVLAYLHPFTSSPHLRTIDDTKHYSQKWLKIDKIICLVQKYVLSSVNIVKRLSFMKLNLSPQSKFQYQNPTTQFTDAYIRCQIRIRWKIPDVSLNKTVLFNS